MRTFLIHHRQHVRQGFQRIIVRLFLFTLLFFILFPAPWTGIRAAEPEADLCDYGHEATLDRFLAQQQEFEPALDAFADKPTIPTAELVALGTSQLRQYRERLEAICGDVVQYNRLEKNNSCLQKSQIVFDEEVAFCWHYVEIELRYQQVVFEQMMLADVAKKKLLTLVNKYKELNKKFSSLSDLFIGMQDGLTILNQKIGKYVAEMCETGG